MALAKLLSGVDLRTNLCSVGKIYDSLSDEDKEAFDEAVAKGIQINTLKNALKEEGYVISWGVLDLHFKKMCKCKK